MARAGNDCAHDCATHHVSKRRDSIEDFASIDEKSDEGARIDDVGMKRKSVVVERRVEVWKMQVPCARSRGK